MYPSSTSAAVIRPDLAAVVEEWTPRNFRFIADRVLPFVDGETLDYVYPIFEVEQLASVPQTRRSSGAEANRVVTEVGKGTGACEWHSLKQLAAWRDQARYGGMFNVETAAARHIVASLLLAREKRVADLVINETTFPPSGDTGEALGAGYEFDHANGLPLSNIARGIEKTGNRTGLKIDSMIINQSLLTRMLAVNTQVRNSMPGAALISGAGQAAIKSLTDLTGIENVLVPWSSYNTAKAGQAASMSQIWPEDYVFLYASGDPMMQTAGLGYTYSCRGSDGRLTVRTYANEALGGNEVEAGMDVSEKIVLSAAGYLIKNTAA